MTAKTLSFTLDKNCLIDIEDDRPAKPHVLALIEAANDSRADVAMVASAASERQIGGGALTSIVPFRERMAALGFGAIGLLRPIGYWEISFHDWSLYGDGIVDREREIFRALFPGREPKWADFAAAAGVGADSRDAPYWRWRNFLCDAQAYWAHEHNGRNVFVTSDANFRKRLTASAGFPAAVIATPAEAAARL